MYLNAVNCIHIYASTTPKDNTSVLHIVGFCNNKHQAHYTFMNTPPPPYPLSLSLRLISDVKLSYFISHLTEAGSHNELGKDGQVLVLAEGSIGVMSPCRDLT